MADYYPLLSRAIAGLADQPGTSRDAIYARAREALERQLRGFEPALTEEAILGELAALEETVARIERENAPEGAPAGAPEAPPAGEEWPPREPEPEVHSQPMVRPRLPERTENPGRKRALALFAGIALVAMLVTGLVAVSRRDTGRTPATPPVVKAPDAAPDTSKTEGRLSGGGGDPAPRAPEPPAPAPTPAPDTKPPQQSAEAPKPPATAGGRAFMVLEALGSAPSQFEGAVAWSFAPDTAIKGQNALRAMIRFEAAGLSVDFSIARNMDAGLNASHTVMVIFEPKNGIGNVREMSAVEWRERESLNGITLAGIVVPVQDNVFMIGLDKTDAAISRNLALLQTQKWMVFEIRLDSGRRGAILVEKGANGEKAVTEALAAWK